MVRTSKVDWGWVARLAAAVLALSVFPVLLGIVLDRGLHTTPVLTLFMILIGFNMGVFTIARSVAGIYAQLTGPKRNSPIGGD